MNSPINFDANCSSLLLKIFFGTPCNFHISSQYIFVISSEEIFIVVAFNLTILMNLSMITTIASFLFDFDNGPIISILISCQGPYGISNECNYPAFF